MTAQDAELLTAAAVALNRHADVLRELGGLFAAAGHELYLVGGSVRDAVLQRPITDLDFATDARPEQLQKLLRPWADALWDTGIEFGTIGAEKNHQRLEITTFRADRYDGYPATRRCASATRLDDDLVRRDFTVNAMAVRVTAAGAAEFVDPLRGLAAVRAGILDTPAAPQVSFGDDPLRMLRAARFVSQLGFTVAPRVRSAIEDMAAELGRITAERVAAELDKLLLGADPVAGIELMVQTGLGDVVLPDVGGMQMAIDEHHQHKDVYQHSLTVLRQAIALEDEGPDLVLRWAALLHDIGKPATRKHEADGGVSFHHHEVVGAKMVRKRLRALKYSKQIVDDVSQLVYLHLRFHGYGDGRWTDSAVRRYVTDAGPLLPSAAQVGARRLHHPQQAPRGPAAGQLRRPRGADRGAGRQGGPAAGTPGPGRQRDHGTARHSGRPAGRRGVAAPQGVAVGPRAADPRGGHRRAAVLVEGPREPVAARPRRTGMEYCLSAGDGAATMWDRGPDLDLDGDGRLDAVGLDFDGDGLADDALADLDGDGIADHAVLDRYDGTAERYFTDDGSGTWAVAADPPARPGGRLRTALVRAGRRRAHRQAVGPTSAPRAVPRSGCSTATATAWPTARSRPVRTA